jgi:hypothetical protein
VAAPVEPVADEHAVISHFNLSDDAFGHQDEREAFFALEDVLIGAIEAAQVGELDGNEFGAGEAVASMYGPDADALFAAVDSHLVSFAARPAYCVLRYGSAGDPTRLPASHRVVDSTTSWAVHRVSPGGPWGKRRVASAHEWPI